MEGSTAVEGTAVQGVMKRPPPKRPRVRRPTHWWDLCAGPHLASTGEIRAKAFELETIAGAYWRGDESQPMLTRIYGTAWETEEDLAA